ncbi:hypothetical protein [Salarchaeum sp. JOR-1]|uniref:hypothetical protein n=1 Tax=Salarchaeum sp. JOR-1 TaxID=2599399 RepID=UPI0011988F73|nr:hypothetical protein [Salarchaeum sp. JOR-1]QDX39806.1 hypothetical protein FQU85_02415 [Salarchaeum sp. JOR-1]
MTLVDDDVLVEAGSRGQNLLVTELVRLVERGHATDEPGVSRERLDAYIDEIGDARDADTIRAELEEQLTDTESWVDVNAVYEVENGRVSRYPASWHEAVEPADDLVDVVRVLNERVSDPPESGASEGIAEEFLLDALEVLGDWERERAKNRIEELRSAGVLAEYTDQHPKAGVRVADES